MSSGLRSLKNQGTDMACEATPFTTTLTGKLEREKENLERRLNEINSALDILKKHPEMKELLDIVSKVA